MCTCVQTRLLIAGVTIVSSLLSFLFLAFSWHMAFVEDRSFQAYFGLPFTVLPLIRGFPFFWPYPFGGLVLGLALPARESMRWALVTGMAGTVLHMLLVRDELINPTLDDQMEIMITHLFPMIFVMMGWGAGQYWQKHRKN